MTRPANTPHIAWREHNTPLPMDMYASPPSSPVELDDPVRQLGPRYALHTGTAGTSHRPFVRASRGDVGQALRHLELQGPMGGAVVPRGLAPSPLVPAGQGVGPRDWVLAHRPAPYGGLYGDVGDFAHQYAGASRGTRGVLGLADQAYAYCLDRGDGEYTRLIPADMLPEIQDVPRRQRGAEGMAVLPVPGGRAPRGVRGDTCPIVFKSQCCHAQTQHRPADPIQSRIDTIVKATPAAAPKRSKVYCDKWVHEGTCAFTQQGCKFKHEMPLDRATQASLGLFHGLPAWWRKQQAELQRQREPASPTGSAVSERGASSFGGIGRDRVQGGGGSGPGVQGLHSDGLGRKGTASASGRHGEGCGFGAGERRAPSPCAFGPIGAPFRGHVAGAEGRLGLAASRHNHEARGFL